MTVMFVSEFRLSPGGVFIPFVRDGGELVQVAMAPMAGAQEAFLMAPEREVGICGNRGSAMGWRKWPRKKPGKHRENFADT